MIQKNKKAAIDVSFNWIFVMIAGAAILIFFIALIATQKDKAESDMAITINTELSPVFSSAELSEGRYLDIDVPKTTLNFECDFSTCTDFSTSDNPSCYSQYEIGTTGINQPTSSQVIFSPSEIKGNKVFTWTQKWNAPFFITNFLYLTGSNIDYLFIDDGNSDYLLELYNQFPEKANRALISIDELSSYNAGGSKKFKFIFLEKSPSEIVLAESITSATESSEITALNILPSLKQIEFYYYDQGFKLADSVNYISEAELFGAVFSEDIDFFRCNMQKAFNRYHIISTILSKRCSSLSEEAPTECQSIYADYNNGLAQIEQNTFIYSLENVNKISSAITTLQYSNQAAKEKSCPLIY